jgi:hypothetical protein
MIITITPEDLVKRCLWNNYSKFIFKTSDKNKIDKFIIENKPFPISEDDAYVIGLLKVVETDNLIHRFKETINDLIDIKSTIQKVDDNKMVLMSKSVIIKECLNFKNNFPESYEQDLSFKNQIDKLNNYINDKLKEIEKLEIIEIEKQKGNMLKTFTYLKSSKLVKIFNLNSIDYNY